MKALSQVISYNNLQLLKYEGCGFPFYVLLYIPISKSQTERERVSHQSYSGKSHLKKSISM